MKKIRERLVRIVMKYDIRFILLILAAFFLSSVSQAMLKKAAEKKYESTVKEYLNPLVISAYILFFVTTLMAIISYRGIPLSLGGVLESTSYIYVTIFGVKFFGEKVNLRKILALILIIAGICIYSFLG